tara:strand:- start:844 stop:1308 length:465 start_codon:yes stop_codon:yes gene_type:complete
MKLTNTNKSLERVGVLLRKGLKQELKDQKHNASFKLSRGIRYHIKNGMLSMMSSVSYWKAVNDPKFAKVPNIRAIVRWMKQKGIGGSATAILEKLKSHYGKPYASWTEGNSLRRTNFAGHTKQKYKKDVVNIITDGVVKDVIKNIKNNFEKYKK